jgi:hypothetical protein
MQWMPYNDSNLKPQEKRSSLMTQLQSFPLEDVNTLDQSLDPLIKNLKEDVDAICNANEKIDEIFEKDKEKFKELLIEKGLTEAKLWDQVGESYRQASYMEDELQALAEIRIIYAFKHLEINIKRLLTTAYPGTNIKSFYKWDSLNDFIKSKGIAPKQLKAYKGVDELRVVNNTLKHTLELNDEVRKIPEFTKAALISHIALDEFYTRVKSQPFVFLNDLCHAIFRERFIFDDQKVDDLAEQLASRLDKEMALHLADKLIKTF